MIFIPTFGAVGGISNCVKPPARVPGHVLVAMRERPCDPVTGSVVVEPPVGFMVSISPRLPGYAVSVETCRGITCCKTAAEAPSAVKLIPWGKLLRNCPTGRRYLHLVSARQQLIISIMGRYY